MTDAAVAAGDEVLLFDVLDGRRRPPSVAS